MAKWLRRWALRALGLEWVETLRPTAAQQEEKPGKPTPEKQLENLLNYDGMERGENDDG